MPDETPKQKMVPLSELLKYRDQVKELKAQNTELTNQLAQLETEGSNLSSVGDAEEDDKISKVRSHLTGKS